MAKSISFQQSSKLMVGENINVETKLIGMKRDHRVRSLKHKAREVACQTDPVELGDLQFGYSENSDEDQEMYMEDMRVEAGTDAPKFLILNVLPGRAKGTDPWEKKEEKEEKPLTKIKQIVNDLKQDNARRGVSNETTDMVDVVNRFAMMKGGTLSDDII